jgi:hypothetical protein
MATRTARVLALALIALTAFAPSAVPRAGEAAVEKGDVTVTLKVSDKSSGFTLEARKHVPKDSNAFDAVRHTVAVAYRTESDGGPFVTGLCGVNAGKGFTWNCYVDGKRCRAIGRTTLTADATIEWKTEQVGG